MLIRTKLWLGFGCLALAAAVLGVISMASLSSISEDFVQLRQMALRESMLANRMMDLLTAIEWAAIHENEEAKEFDAGTGAAEAKSDPAFNPNQDGEPQEQHHNHVEKLGSTINQLSRVIEDSWFAARSGLELLQKENEPTEIGLKMRSIESIFRVMSDVTQLQTEFARYSVMHDANEESAHRYWASQIRPILETRVAPFIRDYGHQAEAVISRETAEISSSIHRATGLCILGIGLIFLVAVCLALYSARNISKPLKRFELHVEHLRRSPDHEVPRLEGEFDGEIGDLVMAFERLRHEARATTVSKDHLDAVLQAMAEGLLVVSVDGTLESVNDAAARLIGQPSAKIPGMPWCLFVGNDSELADGLLRRIEESGAIANEELICRSTAGTEIPILLSGAALRRYDGSLRAYVVTLRDISERKQAEAELAQLNQQLLEASREAGMAEIATGVLHNVGNVLNSVNVSASVVSDQIRKSKLTSLNKVVQLFQEHGESLGSFLSEDPKGRQVPALLGAIAAQLTHEREALTREMENLQQNIEHIKQVVVMQQSYAKVAGVLEPLHLPDLIEDALRFSSAALARHQIEVQRQFEPVPDVISDRHKILQILVNLISNAKHALDHRAENRRLILRIRRGDDNVACIEVQDNGVGIAPDNLTRIFQHGFTTKKAGHGFGLHSGANAARELGGGISVHSEGEGTGATFCLSLPLVEDLENSQAA